MTAAGFRRAIGLAGKIDLGQMVESLARINWADPLWNVLDELAPAATVA